jgi:hypothetical protein
VALLDPLVAQQVAAGEVVDRPASVVKELCENALDAGASRVEVEVADGGRERVLVRDDGSGMGEEDTKLSVLRHATSKIRTSTDIESVMTLGFRGEALPSMASVSAFSLTTATGQGAGTNVTTDGGGNVSVSPASHPKGTTVLVDRLFYNVPARRAFLKSARVLEATAEPKDGPAYELPKNGKGRSIKLTARAVEVLQRHKAAQNEERLGLGPLWKDYGLIFPGHAGQPMRAWSLTGGPFLRLLKRAGLSERTRFHDLRHTCATLLLGKSVHPKIVQELLGHATISITLGTYSHVLPGMGDQAANVMDEAL